MWTDVKGFLEMMGFLTEDVDLKSRLLILSRRMGDMLGNRLGIQLIAKDAANIAVTGGL